MAAKKAVNLSELTFNELKDKAKEIEGFKAMNRFELLVAVKKASDQPVAAEAEKANPRQFKPEIVALKAKLAETTDKKARHELRRQVGRLKRETRKYL
ncbi:MAG: hypothetical protein LBV79_02955 [Candidatus Adiutrix sp.]|jgi:hypothetical protein|nr:hypothetical protein [Candidatus Adiutrix sp.]